MSGSPHKYIVESYDEDAEQWITETRRTSEKDAELDVDLIRMLGRKARIAGDEPKAS